MEGEDMIATIVALVIGIAVFCGGIYYFVKDKKDRESRRIYGVVAAIGAAIVIAVVIKILIVGF